MGDTQSFVLSPILVLVSFQSIALFIFCSFYFNMSYLSFAVFTSICFMNDAGTPTIVFFATSLFTTAPVAIARRCWMCAWF